MKNWLRFLVIGVGIFLLLLAGFKLADLEAELPPAERMIIKERGGDRLAASYYPGSGNAGVILAEGFGSDQITLRSLVEAFSRSGYHVLTFDFSGHGRSSGGLDFDNAETDRLALQLLDVKKIFLERSGLTPRQVILVGHSLGARVALQSAVMDDNPPGGLILLGTQVNLLPSLQAQVFTGVRDTDLSWVKSLGPQTPQTNILLISGDWDDILPPRGAALLYEKLSGNLISETAASGVMDQFTWRRTLLVKNVLHNYEVYSRQVIRAALEGAGDFSGMIGSPDTANLAGTRYLSWGAAVLGLFFLVNGISMSVPGGISSNPPSWLSVERPGRFFFSKLLLWLPALIPGAILGGLIFVVPLGTPAFNLVYISFLGGYGLMLLLSYKWNWIKGIRGDLKTDFSVQWNLPTLLTAGLFGLILVITGLLARTGWFFSLPANHRLIWALIFTPLTAIGFWIGWQENSAILSKFEKPARYLAANTLVGLLPFFLYASFLAAIGSLSGVVGQLQGLVILFFSISCGVLFQKIGKNFLLTSLYQSFLIYWLIMAQGVLFS